MGEDPIDRFEMIEEVNRAASRCGVGPKIFNVFYELSEKGVMRQCSASVCLIDFGHEC